MRGKRTDDTQREIVGAFRDLRCSVADCSGLGRGFPDLVLGLRDIHGCLHNLLVEVKDGSKSPSRRKLTPAQVDFHAEWRGNIHIVASVAEAVALVHRVRLGDEE